MAQQPPPSSLPLHPLPPPTPQPPCCQDLFALCLPRCLLAAAPHGQEQEHPFPHLLAIGSVYPRSGCSRRASPASHGETCLSMGHLHSHRLASRTSRFSKFSTPQHGQTDGLEGHQPLQRGRPSPIPPAQHLDKLVCGTRGAARRHQPFCLRESRSRGSRECWISLQGLFCPSSPTHAPFCPSGLVGVPKSGSWSPAGCGDRRR